MKKSLLLLSSLFLFTSIPFVEVVEATGQAVEKKDKKEEKEEEADKEESKETKEEKTDKKDKKKSKKDPYDPETYEEVYEADQYKIGDDMPEGLYKNYKVDEYAFYTLTEDARGEEFVASGTLYSFAYIEVEEGQYLELDGCFAVPEEEMIPYDPEEEKVYGPGMYLVGFDIEEGEYKAKANGKYPYYSIYKDTLMKDFVDFGNIEKSAYIDVKDDEFLSLVDAEIEVE